MFRSWLFRSHRRKMMIHTLNHKSWLHKGYSLMSMVQNSTN
jgi:hypothetical protein